MDTISLGSSEQTEQSQQPLRYAVWQDSGLADVPIEVNPDATQQWSVDFDVLLGNWVIGTDSGVLWIDDQFLYIVGKLTSFAIPGRRISESFEKRGVAIRPFQRQIWVPIDGDPGVPLAIQFDIKVTPPFVPENIALLDALRYCRNHAQPDIEGQLPPIEAWKNAQTLSAILNSQSGQLFGVAACVLLTTAFAFLLVDEFGLNPFFWVAIFGIAGYQLYRWVSPKLSVTIKAHRSYKAHSERAKAPDLSGAGVTF